MVMMILLFLTTLGFKPFKGSYCVIMSNYNAYISLNLQKSRLHIKVAISTYLDY